MTLNRTWLVVAFAALLAACGSSSSSSGDGNNTPDTADAISSNSTTTGATSANDDDWYYFTTSGAGTIEIDLYGLTGDADIELYDSAGYLLGAGDYYYDATPEYISYTAPSAGTFYVVVIGYDTTDYTLGVTFTPSGGSDSNYSFGTAVGVSRSSTTYGNLYSSADDDYYWFTTTGAGYIDLTLSGLSADADLSLYDGSYYYLSGDASGGTANEYVSYYVSGPGTYYAVVLGWGGATNYTLTVSAP